MPDSEKVVRLAPKSSSFPCPQKSGHDSQADWQDFHWLPRWMKALSLIARANDRVFIDSQVSLTWPSLIARLIDRTFIEDLLSLTRFSWNPWQEWKACHCYRDLYTMAICNCQGMSTIMIPNSAVHSHHAAVTVTDDRYNGHGMLIDSVSADDLVIIQSGLTFLCMFVSTANPMHMHYCICLYCTTQTTFLSPF